MRPSDRTIGSAAALLLLLPACGAQDDSVADSGEINEEAGETDHPSESIPEDDWLIMLSDQNTGDTTVFTLDFSGSSWSLEEHLSFAVDRDELEGTYRGNNDLSVSYDRNWLFPYPMLEGDSYSSVPVTHVASGETINIDASDIPTDGDVIIESAAFKQHEPDGVELHVRASEESTDVDADSEITYWLFDLENPDSEPEPIYQDQDDYRDWDQTSGNPKGNPPLSNSGSTEWRHELMVPFGYAEPNSRDLDDGDESVTGVWMSEPKNDQPWYFYYERGSHELSVVRGDGDEHHRIPLDIPEPDGRYPYEVITAVPPASLVEGE